MHKIGPESILKQQKDIVSKSLEEETIILNLESGDYFSIPDTGLFIWKSLNGTRKLGSIIASLASKYGISASKANLEAMEFIKSLYSNGLVTEIK